MSAKDKAANEFARKRGVKLPSPDAGGALFRKGNAEEPAQHPDDGEDYGQDTTCTTCWGRGEIVTCIDDICHGQEECIHGDGYDVCPDCGGHGYAKN